MSIDKSNSFNTYSVSGLGRNIHEEGEIGHHLDHTRDSKDWDYEKRFRHHSEDESMMNSSEEDERIHRKVCEVLFRDRLLHDRNVEVLVTDGVVTLKGEVPDRKTKDYALERIVDLYGVNEVKNQLLVKADNGLVGDMNWPI